MMPLHSVKWAFFRKIRLSKEYSEDNEVTDLMCERLILYVLNYRDTLCIWGPGTSGRSPRTSSHWHRIVFKSCPGQKFCRSWCWCDHWNGFGSGCFQMFVPANKSWGHFIVLSKSLEEGLRHGKDCVFLPRNLRKRGSVSFLARKSFWLQGGPCCLRGVKGPELRSCKTPQLNFWEDLHAGKLETAPEKQKLFSGSDAPEWKE